MSTDRHIEQLVTEAFQKSAPASAPETLAADAIRAARNVRRRPRWLALVTESPMGRPPTVVVGSPSARMASILVALALTAAIGVFAVLAGGLRPQLAVLVPSASADPTGSMDPGPTVSPRPTPSENPPAPPGLVAYVVTVQPDPEDCNRPLIGLCTYPQLWISNTDGSDAHLLLGDDQESGTMLGWSADGSRMLYQDARGLVVADASGRPVQTFGSDVTCPHPPKDGPNRLDFCTMEEGFSLSPDGTRVAFVRGYGNLNDLTVVAILDIASGTVTELAATEATNGSDQCWATRNCEGTNDVPRWSPDGQSLVFSRQHMSPEPGSTWTSAAVYTIGADGNDLQRVTPKGMFAIDASWSPDGASITFIDVEMIVNRDHTTVTDMRNDVYTIRPDGTEMRRLTDDGRSYGPRWTAAGQITFVRGGWNWLMDLDGSNATRLDFDLEQLTAAGCRICVYPGPSDQSATAWWQP